MTTLSLVRPTLQYLDSYIAVLQRGWSPNSVRPVEAVQEHLAAISYDQAGFVSRLDDPEARGGTVTLPDGSKVPRLPGFSRWLWDGEFCGNIGFRWQPGTTALPANCLGHIGYAVVPWKQNRGYATRALGLLLLLPEVKARNLGYVEVTTDPDNLASQKVILANGGRLVERFTKLAALGGGEAFRYRIDL